MMAKDTGRIMFATLSAFLFFYCSGGSIGNNFSLVNHCDAVASLGFVHYMGGEKYRDALFRQTFKMFPDIASVLRVKAHRRLIQN